MASKQSRVWRRLPVPPEPKIEGIKDQAFVNIHQQARLQVQGREEHRNIYELLVPPEPEQRACVRFPRHRQAICFSISKAISSRSRVVWNISLAW